MVRVPREPISDDGDLAYWEMAIIALLAVALINRLWNAYAAYPGAAPSDAGALEAARKAEAAKRVVRRGAWELLEEAVGGEAFSALRVDRCAPDHAFWLVSAAGRETVVRRRVLRGCLEGRVGDEPLTGRGVACYAPFDGGVALFDGSGAACMTIPENEASDAEIVRVHDRAGKG